MAVLGSQMFGLKMQTHRQEVMLLTAQT